MSRRADSLRLRLRALFRRSRVESEMNDELAFHLEHEIEKHMAAGMSREAARLAAMRAFGGVEQMKEATRDARGLFWLESLLQDVRFAVRGLRRNPGFAAAAVFTLALGIGANTAIFGLLDSVLFRPLPVRDPERLYRIMTTDPATDRGISYDSISYPLYREVRARVRNFEAVGAHGTGFPVHLAFGTNANERVQSAMVSGNFFDLLGVVPAAGRLIVDSDDQPGAPVVMVLSDALWARRFGRDASVIGRAVTMNGTPATIVGVTPAGFGGMNLTDPADVYVAISQINRVDPALAVMVRGGDILENRGLAFLELTGRLRGDATIAQANSELDSMAQGSEYLHQPDRPKTRRFATRPELDAVVDPDGDGRTRQLAWLLFGTVCLVLLLACADVGGLLSVRAERRQHELAVRLALGSSRRRIARQLLVESLVLAAIALGLSLAFAVWMASLLSALTPQDFPLPLRTSASILTSRVFVFSALIAMASAVLFSVLPAWRAGRNQPVDALKSDSRAGGARLSPATRLFVGFEIAACVVLLVGSGLLIHSLRKMTAVHPGFEIAGRVGGAIDIGRQGYTRERGRQFYRDAFARLQSTPGIQSAALTSRLPMSRGNMMTTIEPEGHVRNEEFVAELIAVSPGFFRTLGIPLVAGRDVTLQDNDGAPEVVIISESLARRYWPGQDPLGKRIMNFGEKGGVVVGVARDIRTAALRREPFDAVYVSMGQMYRGSMGIVVQVQDPTSSQIISKTIAQMDATLPVHNERALAANLADSLGRERIVAVLLGAFGILALVLATAGVYSLASMAAQLRTREFGIRVALGATRADILRLVMRQTVGLVLAGLLVGIGVSLYAVRAVKSMLYDVGVADPITMAAVAILLLAAGLMAGYLPGRRATRVDPMVALRYE